MEGLTIFFLFIAGCAVFFYFFLILKWTIGWIKYNPAKNRNQNQSEVSVSVIVAVRNEEHNIAALLNSLCNQSYSKKLYEIIITDDHSSDQTYMELKKFVASKGSAIPAIVYLKSTSDQKAGKKEALERAIRQCKGELILTTDADCLHGFNWIKSFTELFSKTNADMITGLVKLAPSESVIEQLQALEFLSLSGTGAASIINFSPLMCNGANLAFTKKAFIDHGGYSYGANSPSGDDTFLMLKIFKSSQGNVVFNNDPQSVVCTQPVKHLKEFVAQRIRWSTKVKNYSEKYIKLWGLLIFIVNFMLLLSFILPFAGKISWMMVGMLWFMKSLADFIFLIRVCQFAHEKKLLLVFLPAAILYPFYIVTGTLMSIRNKGYNWKDRQYAS